MIKNKIKILKTLFFTSTPIITSSLLISCGQVIDSTEKINQETELKKTSTKESVLNLYYEYIVSQKYSNDSIDFSTKNDQSLDDKNSQFYKDAFLAYKFYVSNERLKKSTWFVDQRANWEKANITSFVNKTTNQSITMNFGHPLDENNFKVLFLNKTSPVRHEIIKMLMVKNYLLNTSEEQVKKSFPDYENKIKLLDKNNTDKKIYESIDLSKNNFFLMKYLLKDKRMIMKWNYKSETDSSKVLAGIDVYINNIQEFNENVQTQSRVESLLTEDISLRLNDEYRKANETQNSRLNPELIRAFTNVETTTENAGDLNYNIDQLKEQKEVINGFLVDKNKIISNKQLLINQASQSGTGDLTRFIQITNFKDGKSEIDMSYILKLTPLFEEDTAKTAEYNKDKKDSDPTIKRGFFTFKNTPWDPDKAESANELTKLAYWLYRTDNSLFTQAKNHFSSIGYKIESNNPIIRDLLKNEGILK